jgi:hypothetical protein
MKNLSRARSLRHCMLAAISCFLAGASLQIPAYAALLSDEQTNRILELTLFGRQALCMAQTDMQQDSKSAQALQRSITYSLYQLRPSGVWDESHPAWKPAKKALLELMAPDTSTWLNEFWNQNAKKIVVSDLHYAFTEPEGLALLEFAETPGARLWFNRRLSECKLKTAGGPGEIGGLYRFEGENYSDPKGQLQDATRRFDALSGEEKRRVADFTAGAKCAACARAPFAVLNRELEDKARWLADVLSGHFDVGTSDYQIRQRWVAQLEARLGPTLPVLSKKQYLGNLEMQQDRTVEFRFTYYWNDKPAGGTQVLRFPATHLNYQEVLNLAPNLVAGAPRALYRDANGVISDQP